MPQQGLGPPIKSREVNLESLHFAIDVGFLYVSFLVIPFVNEPDSYENTTVASGGIDMRPRLSVGVIRILPSDWLGQRIKRTIGYQIIEDRRICIPLLTPPPPPSPPPTIAT